MRFLLVSIPLPILPRAVAASADLPCMVGIASEPAGDGWRVEATLAHADGGGEHSLDACEVSTPGGTVLGRRDLLHPHETGQRFARSLAGIAVPDGVSRIHLRAHDSRHRRGGTMDHSLSR